MSVSSPFIRRPIATSLLGIAILICGILGFLRLPVASLPQVDFPTIQVTTRLPGANPDTIASLVTAPLERQFGQIPALAGMSSQSSFGLSQVTLQFELDRDIDSAAQDVQSAINAAGSTLPRNLPYPPTYNKVNPADAAIVTIALTSKTVPLRALSDLADTLIAQRLAEVSGVGAVTIQGGVRPAIRIQADLARLAAYGMSLADIRTAVTAANVAGPKGALDGPAQAYTIAANDQLAAVEAYREIILTYRNGAPVFLRDVAEIVDGLEDSRVAGRLGADTAVILDVQRQPGANVVDTVDRLRAQLPRLQNAIPAGVELKLVQDRTDTIRASIHEVQFTLVLSCVLVVLVVLLFLRTVRATIIAGVALPLSIVATFGVMWLAGFSLDNLSLMALTIGTGFVVDDAIVMIENIVRKIEEGDRPFEAALSGAREIGFTIISLTVSLVAVFIPLLFMTGLVGRMFREFALTLTIAVVVSAIISLTLTPMMCAMLLRRQEGESRWQRIVEAPIRWMSRVYDVTLLWVLKRPSLMMAVMAATLALTGWLYVVIPKGFLPDQDTGLLSIVVEAAPDASFAEMTRLQDEVSAVIRRDGDVVSVTGVVGVGPLNPTPNVARLTAVLKPLADRRASAAEIGERLKAAAAGIPGATLYVQTVPDIRIATRASRSQYQYTLSGVEAAEVSAWAARMAQALRADPALRNVALETQEGGLRAKLIVDRETAGRLGVSIQTVTDALNDAFGQRQISTIYGQSNQFRVVLEASPQYQQSPDALSKLYVPASLQVTLSTTGAAPTTAQGARAPQIPLSAFTRMERTTAPLSIAHQEQFPAATISFDVAPGSAIGTAVEAVARVEREAGLPSSVTGSFSGDAAEFQHALAGQPWLILAAAITIYIVLGMLYESFIHPLTILSTLPSAGVGALLALMAFGHDLSVVALIGIILLMGIVKKNAIMMIDFALVAERDEGLSPLDSIVKACRLRFRPIMMTTLAALLGAVPLAIGHGPGFELRVPLGITIIGGLVLSQLITLYTTPVIYLGFEGLRRRWGGSAAREPFQPELPLRGGRIAG
ncbi:efflux RND transporter permease subunit [Enterovirga rhinocerotis]|uniref:Multidrug efflux pump n=1 Tax=Enterovirga rhinocerotis TaxID=1339210 RepID=A0A4R7BR68_9HYPH|nr:efflux RND transporter permease subunit [Enterovirga rhinocerotis]TDR87272.1 multidrug efflux pump [Enterovirga rhinocerotis]